MNEGSSDGKMVVSRFSEGNPVPGANAMIDSLATDHRNANQRRAEDQPFHRFRRLFNQVRSRKPPL